MKLHAIDIAIIPRLCPGRDSDRALGFAARGEGSGLLLLGQQIVALVLARDLGRVGNVRHQRDDPAFQPNRNCGQDCANVRVGIVWQLCLTAPPIYLVLQNWSWVGAIIATLAVTTLFIKFNWYDKLEKAT